MTRRQDEDTQRARHQHIDRTWQRAMAREAEDLWARVGRLHAAGRHVEATALTLTLSVRSVPQDSLTSRTTSTRETTQGATR